MVHLKIKSKRKKNHKENSFRAIKFACEFELWYNFFIFIFYSMK